MIGKKAMDGGRRASRTYEQIITRIRGSISAGELRPGDRLPPEADLARSLGVSRPTVREALKVLEALNVLESSTGPTGGTFVRPLDGAGVAEYLTDSISLLLDVDELTPEELYAAREAIEVPAAGMAAARRTEEDLDALQAVIEGDELKDFDTLVADISFHRALAAASKNRMLSLFVNAVHMTLRTITARYILPEAKQASQRQHRLIYEAIVAGDEALARGRMREHLGLAREIYTKAMRRQETDPSTRTADAGSPAEGLYGRRRG